MDPLFYAAPNGRYLSFIILQFTPEGRLLFYQPGELHKLPSVDLTLISRAALRSMRLTP